jgi:hypothetical protein
MRDQGGPLVDDPSRQLLGSLAATARHMAVSLAAYALIAGQEATRYWLSRQRWNRATLLTTTAYGSRAIISA